VTQKTSLDLNHDQEKRRTMSAKTNFCPAGEELESRSLLNVGTALLGAIAEIDGVHAVERRAMVHQRVHARTFPRTSVHNATSTKQDAPVVFTWQFPAGTAHNFPRAIWTHLNSGQLNTTGDPAEAQAAVPVAPAHVQSYQNTPVILISALNLPAGAMGAIRGG
jgi:hypothetical protein